MMSLRDLTIISTLLISLLPLRYPYDEYDVCYYLFVEIARERAVERCPSVLYYPHVTSRLELCHQGPCSSTAGDQSRRIKDLRPRPLEGEPRCDD